MADTFIGYSNKRGRINPFLNQYYATSGNVPNPEILRNIVSGELDAAYKNRIMQQEMALRKEQLDAQKEYWDKASESAESANRMQMLSNIGGLATTALGTWDKWKDSPVGKGVSYVGDVLGKGYDWLTGNTPPTTPLQYGGRDTITPLTGNIMDYVNPQFSPLKDEYASKGSGVPYRQGFSGMPTADVAMRDVMPEEPAQTRKIIQAPPNRNTVSLQGMNGEIDMNWGGGVSNQSPTSNAVASAAQAKQKVPDLSDYRNKENWDRLSSVGSAIKTGASNVFDFYGGRFLDMLAEKNAEENMQTQLARRELYALPEKSRAGAYKKLKIKYPKARF